jgi:hypothetical protein
VKTWAVSVVGSIHYHESLAASWLAGQFIYLFIYLFYFFLFRLSLPHICSFDYMVHGLGESPDRGCFEASAVRDQLTRQSSYGFGERNVYYGDRCTMEDRRGVSSPWVGWFCICESTGHGLGDIIASFCITRVAIGTQLGWGEMAVVWVCAFLRLFLYFLTLLFPFPYGEPR